MSTESKTHWKKVFLSDYLGACDLEDGKDLKIVIKSVEVREIKGNAGEKQNRNVAVFTDSKIKPMILNATNCKIIKKFANSTFIEDWKNVAISVYVKPDIKAFGDVTEGLRVREMQPKMEKPNLTPGTQGWTGAIEFLKGAGTMEKIKAKYSLSEANEELLKEAVL